MRLIIFFSENIEKILIRIKYDELHYSLFWISRQALFQSKLVPFENSLYNHKATYIGDNMIKRFTFFEANAMYSNFIYLVYMYDLFFNDIEKDKL